MADIKAIEAWIKTGIDAGYCSELVCATHSADYMTEQEAEATWNGEEPCVFVIRVWDA